MKEYNHRSGQALLLIILVSMVLFTVALSVSQLTVEETKIAKLEEDSKRALQAAEAGLEAALKQSSGSVDLERIVGGGITGQAIIQTDQSPTFTTPLLQKDDQYTFYLSNYTPADPDDPSSQQQFSNQFSGKLKISRREPQSSTYCTDNNGNNNFAVELTFVNATTGQITARKLIDSCPSALVSGSVDKVNFDDFINVVQSDLMIIRIIAQTTSFPGAQLDIINDNTPQQNWYLQGKTIVSTAATETAVTKKIQLFQTYPQIPLEFWATSL